MEEAWKNFLKAVPFFNQFHPHAPLLAYFRDHAMLVYKHLGLHLWQEYRRFPKIADIQPDALKIGSSEMAEKSEKQAA